MARLQEAAREGQAEQKETSGGADGVKNKDVGDANTDSGGSQGASVEKKEDTRPDNIDVSDGGMAAAPRTVEDEWVEETVEHPPPDYGLESPVIRCVVVSVVAGVALLLPSLDPVAFVVVSRDSGTSSLLRPPMYNALPRIRPTCTKNTRIPTRRYLLQQWSTDPEKLKYLSLWLRCVIERRKVGMSSALCVADPSPVSPRIPQLFARVRGRWRSYPSSLIGSTFVSIVGLACVDWSELSL